MAFSRSFVLVALLVALIALLCAPQPTEARFFGFRRRFRCGRRFDKFLFKRAARFGDGEDFCLNTLNGVEYDITSGVGESRCRVVCRGIPSPSLSSFCSGVDFTFVAIGRGDSCTITP